MLFYEAYAEIVGHLTAPLKYISDMHFIREIFIDTCSNGSKLYLYVLKPTTKSAILMESATAE
jgi:hypothetical protein